ncbi:GspE/PulE family protein [bacterium]|nr:GspE/PulE family protein [bacterium]
MVETRRRSEPLANPTIQAAVEEFFDRMDREESPGAEPSRARERMRRRGDGRADLIQDALIRVALRKDAIRQADVDAAFERAFSKLPSLVNAELVLVYVLQERGKIRPLGAGSGKLALLHAFLSASRTSGKPSAVLRFDQGVARLKQRPLDPAQGILGKALWKGTSITTHDAKSDPQAASEVDKAIGFETTSMLTVPIQEGGVIFGAVQLMNKDRTSGAEFFSLQDQRLVEDLSGHVARIMRRFLDPKLEPSESDMARSIAHLARTDALDLSGPTAQDPKRAAIVWDAALWETVGVEAIRKYTIQEAFAATPGQIQQALEKQLGGRVRAAETDALLDRVASAVAERPVDASEVEKLEPGSDAPIIQLANHLIEDAQERGASDIHIEPGERDVRIRYRVDGNLFERMRLPRQAHEPLIVRLKIMAPPMKIDERRLPQDGKIKFKNYSSKGVDLDLRVATSPSSQGERCVLRLLAKQSIALGLEAMGFTEENLAAFRWASKQPYGMVLCCGPTGSGKTTTLYAALSEINTPDVNILTAEDPIEYPLTGITQVQINKKIGLSFARALKAFLRMDPDVILVGEIRDRRTASTAIEAALTGHLLLSTLHTNDAASTVTRFIEMKIEPFLITSCLLLVSAQRLARRLCKSCKEPLAPSDEALELLAADPHPIPRQIFRSSEKGCEHCQGTGYKGRVGIHEILAFDGEMGNVVRDLVHRKAGSETIKARAVELGMRTMWQDALWKVKEGITDLREVAAIVRADNAGPRGAALPARKTPSRGSRSKK